MRKKRVIAILLVLAMMLTLLPVGAMATTQVQATTEEVQEEIYFFEERIVISLGGVGTTLARLRPFGMIASNVTIANPEIASFEGWTQSPGETELLFRAHVQPLAVGETVMTVTSVDGRLSASIIIEVTERPVISVQEIRFPWEYIEMGLLAGARLDVAVGIYPGNANTPNQVLTFTSTNPQVADVEGQFIDAPQGVARTMDFRIRAHELGETVITASTLDGAVSASIRVYVIEPEPMPVLWLDFISESMLLAVGSHVSHPLRFGSGGALAEEILVHSSNEEVALVTVGDLGISNIGEIWVETLSVGETTITASTVDGSVSTSMTLYVEEGPFATEVPLLGALIPDLDASQIDLFVGGNAVYHVFPNPVNARGQGGWTFTSSHSEIVSVQQYIWQTEANILVREMYLRAHSAGEASITIKAADGSVIEEITVVVRAVQEEIYFFEERIVISLGSVGTTLARFHPFSMIVSNVSIANPEIASFEGWTQSLGGTELLFRAHIQALAVGETVMTATSADGTVSASIIIEVVDSAHLVGDDLIHNIFPDPVLAELVAEELGLTVNDTVTQGDLDGITGIQNHGDAVGSLQGVELLRNLRGITSRVTTEFSDLSPLADLDLLFSINLISEHHFGGQITDLSPLAGLSNLWELSLMGFSISDVSPLAELTELGVLFLQDNFIEELSPLAGLINLQRLGLPGNQISDVSPLAGLVNLQGLGLGGNQISDLSPLAGLTGLIDLNVGGNQISDITPLAALVNLQWLGLADNQISDISPLANMRDLYTLVMHAQEIILAPIVHTDEIRVENMVRGRDGNLLTPENISHGGRYEAPYIIWENVSGDQVTFSFSQHLSSPDYFFGFDGTVILPLEAPVEQNVPVTGFSINPSANFNLNRNATRTIIATVAPANATNQTVLWESSNPNVASVTETGVVSGNAIGTAIITATTEDGDFTQSVRVTVQNPTTGGGGGSWTAPPAPGGPPETPEVPEEENEEENGETQTPPAGDFTDVTGGSWYYSYVRFVAENGIMQGVGDGNFAPGIALDRSMLATILWRVAGQPETSGNPAFTDVRPGMWYTDAITWAHANGIVQGVGAGQFAPGQDIRREEFAVMMFRFANATGENTTVPENFVLDQFTDAGEISPWAKEAFVWAVYTGLINGTSATTLAPSSSATRGETAAILTRFLEE